MRSGRVMFSSLCVLLLVLLTAGAAHGFRFAHRQGSPSLCMSATSSQATHNKITISYCTKCKWSLRASWLAQELLSTFPPTEVHEVALVPISEPAGVFTVEVNHVQIWDRRSESTPGFPEAKELKQLVRDVVAPEKGLGHSDSSERKSLVMEAGEGASDGGNMGGGGDKAAIAQVVKTYLDGVYEGDVSKLASIFHPTSLLTHINGTSGELKVVPRDEWFTMVRNRASPLSLNLQRHDEILSIDVISPTTAFAKVKCAIEPRFFTDSLNLLKVDGAWTIVQKLFSVEVR